MSRLLGLVRGLPGHPSHPPLTDATIGAFTTGTVLTVIGAFGLAEAQMADGGFLAIVVGLVFALPTILTGFLDYFRLRRGTPMRTTATIHWVSNVSATTVFLAAAAVLLPGLDEGEIPVVGAVLAAVAWTLLLVGGWIGGALVFVYGIRVQGETATPTADAIKPRLPVDS